MDETVNTVDGGPSRAALWYGIFGAPGAWSVDDVLSTYLHEGACARVLGHPSLAPVLLGVAGVVLGAVAFGAGLTAWRSLGRLGLDTGANGTLVDQRRFMAHAGLILSGLFFYGIVLRFITVFFLRPCVFP